MSVKKARRYDWECVETSEETVVASMVASSSIGRVRCHDLKDMSSRKYDIDGKQCLISLNLQGVKE